jgi:starch synthase
MIYEKYGSKDFVSKKKANKTALQRELGLVEDEEKFIISMVTRLTSQKGVDLLNCVLDDICFDQNIQIVILGTGDKQYEDSLRYFDWKYHGRVSAQIRFDNTLAHKIYAGSDVTLMPSLFEPCGLNQLIAMRYGTLPVVRETGGLKDTVEPYNEYEGTGTGFSFKNYNAHEMLGVIRYAHEVYYNHRKEWNAICRRAMSKDYSWTKSAKEYIDLYESLV